MPSPRATLEELPFVLARATLSFRRFSDQTLRAVGLSALAPGFASVLHAVEDCGPCNVNGLIEHTHLANGTLTGLLDGLEAQGWIKRLKNPADGRSWLVQLTPSGRKVCKKLQARHQLVVAFLRTSFSESEAEELTSFLEKASAQMRRFGQSEEAALPSRRLRPKISRDRK